MTRKFILLLFCISTQLGNCSFLLSDRHLPDEHESRTLLALGEEDSDSCGAQLQVKFNCSEFDCKDRVAGMLRCIL